MTSATVDKRIRRTRRLLREAFIELVDARGYEDIRVEDILIQADIGRTTFYAHFRDKRDLLQHIADTFNARFQKDLTRESIDEHGHIRLENIIGMFESFERNSQFFKIVLGSQDIPILQEHVLRSMRTLVTKILSDQINFLKITPSLPIPLLSEVYLGSLLATVRWWLTEGQDLFTAKEVAEHFYRLDLDGRASVMGLPSIE